MICVFEISSPEDPKFKRLIHISLSHSFDDFHQIIQNSSNFDQSQLASFFLTDEHWRKQIEIGSLDSGEISSAILCMRNVKLSEFVAKVGQKLIYVFDFFNERFFYLELKEKLMNQELKEPFVAYERGDSPVQYLIAEFEKVDIKRTHAADSYESFGDLEDYYEIFGEMDV